MNTNNLKTFFVAMVIVYFIITVVSVFNTYATSLDKQTIFQHNGQEFQTGSFTYSNRIYVPLRTISNQFGYEVKWNSSDKTIKISNNKSYIQFQLNSKIIKLSNNKTITMDVEPLVIDEKTYIPLRYAIEPLGKFIQYYEDKKVRVINITDKQLIQDTKR